MIDLLDSHGPMWLSISQMLHKNRLPQALLFIGPRHAKIVQFANRLIAVLLCETDNPPCGQCRACHLFMQGGHPDITYISQETPKSAIKIEQIRLLQQDVYQTPQRGSRRFILIDPADKLNSAAANALLKILEEPPSHTTFILLAEQVGSIPATILSRCQKYIFPTSACDAGTPQANYLMMGQFYPTDSARSALLKEADSIISGLCELIEEKCSPCTIAARWSGYDFDDLVWLLHLIIAEAINYRLITSTDRTSENTPLMCFSRMIKPMVLFNCLDQINAITKKINHNVNMNQTLVLEDLLLGYTVHRHTRD